MAHLTHVSEMEKKCETLARITAILKDVIQNKVMYLVLILFIIAYLNWYSSVSYALVAVSCFILIMFHFSSYTYTCIFSTQVK